MTLLVKCFRNVILNNLKVKPSGNGNSFLFSRSMATARKRFYKSVSVTQNNGIFEINLDGRKLKTPFGKVFQVASEPLAAAIAAEWNAQDEYIQQSRMHLTTLSNTVIENPAKKTSETLCENILSYLETDTLRFRSPEVDDLSSMQEKRWDPVLEWCCQRYNVEIPLTKDIVPPPISTAALDNFKKHLLSYSFASLLGFQLAVDSIKSLILTLAVVDRFLTVEEAVSLSRLEQEFQIKYWGNVEYAHDLELMDSQARLAAAVIFIYVNNNNTVMKQMSANV